MQALSALAQLEVHSQEATASAGDFMMRLTWVLSQASNLRLLSLTIGPISWFPPMAQLKHLELKFSHQGPGNVFGALLDAVGLHTLYLGLHLSGNGITVLEAPALCLTALKELRVVALQSIRPAEIFLSESCALSLKRLDEHDLSQMVWNSVRKNVFTLESDVLPMPLNQIPPIICNSLVNLSTVALWVAQIGEARAPLPLDGLAHVTRLQLRGTNVYVSVPSRVLWKRLHIAAKQKLDLSFKQPHSFAKDVMNMRFRYQFLEGPWMAELCGALAAEGRKWHAQRLRYDLSVLHAGDGKTDRCSCGACFACLRSQGIASFVAGI